MRNRRRAKRMRGPIIYCHSTQPSPSLHQIQDQWNWLRLFLQGHQGLVETTFLDGKFREAGKGEEALHPSRHQCTEFPIRIPCLEAPGNGSELRLRNLEIADFKIADQ